MLHLELPIEDAKVLLHSCCAPCSGAILECMLANGIRPTIFFSNSNIAPEAEYRLRLDEISRYAGKLGLALVEDVYDHEAWLDFVLLRTDGVADRHLAELPERGERCMRCFIFRMRRSAMYAAAHGYGLLTTSLASSRWKDLSQVNEAGREAVGYAATNAPIPPDGSFKLLYWDQNWRKGGLQPRRSEIIREENFYNQSFCGCEFSERH